MSLFPGLGMLDWAFTEAGFCVVAGPDKLFGGDIHDFRPPAGRFDGVIGGSPCQAFSALANLVRAKAIRGGGMVMLEGAEERKALMNLSGELVFRGAPAEIGEVVFAGLPHEIGEWLGLARSLVPEFERVVAEAAPLWFLHENVPAAPIPSPRGYSVQDFTICNSSIPGEDGLGQEQERVRRFTFGVRCQDGKCFMCLPVTSKLGSPESKVCATCGGAIRKAPDLLRWIPRAALRLPACQRTGAVSRDDTRGKRDRKNGWGEPRPGRVRQPGVAYDDGPGTRERLRVGTVAADPGVGNVYDKRTPGSTPRRSLGEMLRLQGFPEDLLDDLPLTAKAARKLVANGVPMPLGRAVARAVVEALRELSP